MSSTQLMKSIAAVGTLAALGAQLATASAKTLTFDELSFRPANGVTISGVTFGFEVGGSPSDDASYNALGPGSITYLDEPVLEGDAAGLLFLSFHQPVYDLSFGLALTSFAAVDPAAAISFYDEFGVFLDSQLIATEPLIDWSEGYFETTFSTPFRLAVLEFNSSEADRFALDNLTYTLIQVPDSGGLGVFSVMAILGLAGWRRFTR